MGRGIWVGVACALMCAVSGCAGCGAGEEVGPDVGARLDGSSDSSPSNDSSDDSDTADPSDGGGAVESSCDDGEDEDSDGLPDCADPDCVDAIVCEGIPADPADAIGDTRVFAAPTVAGLIEAFTAGASPLQRDVDPGRLVPSEVGVLRGRVLDRGGRPLAGARVEVFSDASLGHTRSRADGVYDLLVPGGSRHTVKISRAGYPDVFRSAFIDRGEPGWLPDAAMTRLSDVVTLVDTSSGDSAVAVGEVVGDAFGERTARLYFPPEVEVEFEFEGGRRAAHDGVLSVRATEYTVGADGPDAMPGALPRTTAYTYALELSADEARAQGARHVHFSAPVSVYVDDFLSVPTGSAMPLGIFDPARGWEPHLDGVAMEVLGVEGGLAEVDLDGDGVADGSPRLDALGLTDDELQALATQYPGGAKLWRVRVPHFSAIDINPPRSVPIEPPLDPPRWEWDDEEGRWRRRPGDDAVEDCERKGSVIDCLDRTVRDTTALRGTPYSVWVVGDASESNRTITIEPWDRVAAFYDGSELPPLLPVFFEAVVSFEAAGHRLVERYDFDDVASSPTVSFTIPLADAWGRSLEGTRVQARVSVAYRYRVRAGVVPVNFEETVASFAGYVPEDAEALPEARDVVSLVSSFDFTSGPLGNRGAVALDVLHRYDLRNGEIVYGDGSREKSDPRRVVSSPAPGVFYRRLGTYEPELDDPPDPGPFALSDVVELEGGVRVGFDARADLFTGGDPSNPATYSRGLGVALMIVDEDALEHRVFWTAPSDFSGPRFDGLEARSADEVSLVRSESDDRFGAFAATVVSIDLDTAATSDLLEGVDLPDFDYFAEIRDHAWLDGRVLAITGRGVVYDGQTRDSEEVLILVDTLDGVATSLLTHGGARDLTAFNRRFSWPPEPKIDFDDEGRLFVVGTSEVEGGLIWALATFIGVDRLQLVTGSSVSRATIASQEDTDNAFAALEPARDLMVASNGDVYVLTRAGFGEVSRVLVVTETGLRARVLGGGTNRDPGCMSVSGGDPTRCQLIGFEQLVGVEADGALVLHDTGGRIARVSSRWPLDDAASGFRVPSDDGLRWFTFDAFGVHLSTHDAITGRLLRRFEYDDVGRPARVLELGEADLTTLLEWEDDRLVRVVGPNGHVSNLTYDSSGAIETIAHPDGVSTSYEIGTSGLILSKTLADGATKSYSYDGARLSAVTRPGDDGTASLAFMSPMGGGSLITWRDEQGLETSFYERRRDSELPYAFRVDYPTGAHLAIDEGEDGELVVRGVDGTVRRRVDDAPSVISPAADQVRGRRYAFSDETPSGRTLEVRVDEAMERPRGQLAARRWERRLSMIGGGDSVTWSEDYDHDARTSTTTSAAGAQTLRRYDDQGREIEVRVDPALEPWTTTYDSNGAVASRQGRGMSWDFTWDRSLMTSKRDALDRTFSYTYDDASRLASVTLPGTQTYAYTYDPMGRMATMTMPEGGELAWTYTPGGKVASRTLPGRASTSWEYGFGGALTRTTLPDGRDVARGYGASTGLLTEIVTPEDVTSFTYTSDTAQVDALRRADGAWSHELRHDYDGPLLTRVESAFGADVYALDLEYDGLWRAEASTLAGHRVRLDRNEDGHVVRLGEWSATRDGPANAVTRWRRGTIEQRNEYDGQGRLVERSLWRGSTPLYGYELEPAADGTVAVRREFWEGAERVDAFEYDPNRRLTLARRDGAPVEGYTWDDDGNPIAFDGATASFDLAGEVTSWSTMSVNHDANGHVIQMGDWAFSYGARGDLRTAASATKTVTYRADWLGRLVERSEGSSRTRFLYTNLSKPMQVTATADASGALTHYLYDDFGHLIEVETPTDTYVIGTDQVGTPRVAARASTGAVVATWRYSSFGVPVSSTGSLDLWVGFAGGIADPDTGLVRFGLRDYAPEMGRWTRRDPLGVVGSPSNLYAYVGSNPIASRDPTGLFCVGGSFYSGIGGGGSLCFDRDGIGGCAEWGVGAGGGVDFQPAGSFPGNLTEVEATVTAGAGPLGLEAGFKVNSCGDAEGVLNGNLGPFSVPIFKVQDGKQVYNKTNNDFVRNIKDLPEAARNASGPFKVGVEAKIAVRRCRKLYP